MKKIKLSLGLLFTLLFFDLQANHLHESLMLTAKLTGSEEVPAVSTYALGVAGFVFNAYRDTVCVNINLTGLSGPITEIQIHEGMPGTNGPAIKDLTPYLNGNRVVLTLSGVDISANIDKYLSGKMYLNVHTAANPNGEIRGQILLETDYSYTAWLNGAQQVPAVGTGAGGVAVFNVARDLSAINYHVTLDGLSGAISGAHLHTGAMGMNGPVVVDLTPFISGNTINGTIANPPAALIDSLKAGLVYINTHTAANPNGEIRGQLMYTPERIYFDARLNGAQEIPAVAGTGIGNTGLMLNSTLDTLWVWAVASDLSGAISGAHIHSGAVGISGPVLIDLMPFLTANQINAVIYGAALTPAVINALLRGETYINLHTAANPNGEIRGQIYRLVREGYSFHMDGDQQVPMVNTQASGGGIVSIDRDESNAHIMLTSTGLNSSGIHFHQGVMGSNGPVIFDLAPYYTNDGIFMYWNSANVTPFDMAMSLRFRNDSIYVNNHTAAYPNGEIRGQAERGFMCFAGPNGVDDHPLSREDIVLTPNPFIDEFQMVWQHAVGEDVSLQLIDLSGKVVLTSRQSLKSGYNRIVLHPTNLSDGLYLLQVQTSKEKLSLKLIKQE